MGLRRVLTAPWRLPLDWWRRQSLRARLTLLATALFSFAVLIGAILVLTVQRYALLRVLDGSAQRYAAGIARQVNLNVSPMNLDFGPIGSGVTGVEIVDARNHLINGSSGFASGTPLITLAQLEAVRHGAKIDRTNSDGTRQRILGRAIRSNTILVVTDLSRVDDSLRILRTAVIVGGPLAVLLMGTATYLVVAATLRPVAALRHGAADITAAGLSNQRLPVPGAQDEINRLAVTLNAMLDRIDSATSKQRTFVGDAAHELRSPLASLRVQLEVAQRMGPDSDWNGLIDDVLIDVARLDRLVNQLLTLARSDEATNVTAPRETIRLDELVQTVTSGYLHARVPVTTGRSVDATVLGDLDSLRRVVINLVDNAVRHANSEVVVGVHRGGPSRRDSVLLTVTDDGPGIPEAERERVFDRFYRVEASRSRESGGSGLGLPIVREIVRSHGGTVRLTSRRDGKPGLTAVVVLPASEAQAE